MKYVARLAALVCAGVLASGVAQAVNVNFTGKLIDSTCNINLGNDIDIPFGTFRKDQIESVPKREIQYTVDNCPVAGIAPLALKVKLDFTKTSWDDSVQAKMLDNAHAANKNLGIEIYDGTGVTVYRSGTLKTVTDNNNPPRLYAHPKKNPGGGLGEGDFTASATLTAIYE